MKTILQLAIEASEAGADYAEAKQCIERELKRPTTRSEQQIIYDICGP